MRSNRAELWARNEPGVYHLTCGRTLLEAYGEMASFGDQEYAERGDPGQRKSYSHGENGAVERFVDDEAASRILGNAAASGRWQARFPT